MSSNYAGRRFGERYTLTRLIATGAMGEVWAARDSVTSRKLAVKVLRPELAGQDRFLQRLRVEARNAMQINHPNLAAVLDHGEADGVGWIVMELVEGRPFNEFLAGGNRIAPSQLLPVLLQTAYALQAAKAEGVVHRDIKPSNILLRPDGFVKLTDFGISITPNQATMTDAGMVMGTAQYLPPEQARGEDATHQGDLYALGVIAYEALAGRRPFGGKTQVDVAFSHVNDPVPPLPEDVPEPLVRIVMRLLRKNPKDRPADALELVRALTEAAQELALDVGPTPVSLPDADDFDSPHTRPAVAAPAPASSLSSPVSSARAAGSASPLPSVAWRHASCPVPAVPWLLLVVFAAIVFLLWFSWFVGVFSADGAFGAPDLAAHSFTLTEVIDHG